MAPKSLDTPEKLFIALQMGAEIGLSPMQSVNNIAVVNNRPSVWGDALSAIIRRSIVCKSLSEPKYTGKDETRVCTVKAERTNGDTCSATFGYADAKKAGLLSRDTYRNYPDDMYWRRALGRAAKQLFSDVLCGLALAEEQQDIAYADLEPSLESGDDAPLDSLDDAAALLAADDHPSDATPEELADMRRELEEERRPHGDKLFETKSEFDSIPF
jgi:hypothetical protein